MYTYTCRYFDCLVVSFNVFILVLHIHILFWILISILLYYKDSIRLDLRFLGNNGSELKLGEKTLCCCFLLNIFGYYHLLLYIDSTSYLVICVDVIFIILYSCASGHSNLIMSP